MNAQFAILKASTGNKKAPLARRSGTKAKWLKVVTSSVYSRLVPKIKNRLWSLIVTEPTIENAIEIFRAAYINWLKGDSDNKKMSFESWLNLQAELKRERMLALAKHDGMSYSEAIGYSQAGE